MGLVRKILQNFRKKLSFSTKKILILCSAIFIALLGMIIFRNQIRTFFQADAGADPIAYWKFNEGSGDTAYDSSGNGYSLTRNGTASWYVQQPSADTAQSGSRAARFNGGTSSFSRTYESAFDFGTGSFSIAGSYSTAQTDGANETGVILSRTTSPTGVGFKIFVNNNALCFAIDDTDGAPFSGSGVLLCTNVLKSDQIHNFVAIKGTNYIGINVDGKGYAVGEAEGSISGSAPLYIGTDSDGTSYPFVGMIDNIAIYDYEITSGATAYATGERVTATFGAGQNASLTEGLLAYWPMDESTANSCTGGSNDSCDKGPSGYYDAAWNGNATVSTGKFGNALTLDGNGDHALLGNTMPPGKLGKTHSASFWINYQDSGDANIIGQQSGLYMTYIDGPSAGDSIYYNNNDGGYVSVVHGGLTSGTWYHFAVVRDNLTVRFYKNGQLLGTSQSLVGNGNLHINSIGALVDGSFPFQGQLDEIRIYEKALTAAEVTILYNATPGPVGYWKFDEGSGTSTFDTSGNGHTGTLAGNPTWTQGKYGGAVNFDGSDDSMNGTSNSSLDDLPNGDFSVSWWMNHKSDGQGAHNIINKDTWQIRGNNTCTDLTFQVNFSGTNLSYIINTGLACNTWTHMNVIFLSATKTARIYINGVEASYAISTAGSGTFSSDSSASLIMGRQNDFNVNMFYGQLDDVKIYNYARTPSQIIEDMNAGHPAVGTPVGSTVLHFKLDEGYGSTINDSSPQRNNGSIVGTSAPTWTQDGKFGKALSFDNSNDFINVADDDSLDVADGADISLAAWIKIPTLSDNNLVIAKKLSNSAGHAGYYMYINSAGLIAFYAADGADQVNKFSSRAVTANTWVHVVGIYDDDSDIKLYINGKDAGGSLSGTLANVNSLASSTRLSVGAEIDGELPFSGVIDDVRIYPFALTLDQIKTVYNQGEQIVLGSQSTGVGGTSPSNSASREYCIPGDTSTCNVPVGEWKFNEGIGTSAFDTSGNGNNGTITIPSWTRGKYGSALKASRNNIREYVAVTDPANGILDVGAGADFTATFWYKSTDFSESPFFVRKIASLSGSVPGYYVGTSFAGGSNSLVCGVIDGTNFDEAIYEPPDPWTLTVNGNWHQVACVLDRNGSELGASGLYLLLDGAVVASDTSLDATGSLANSENLNILEWNTLNEIDGSIDDVRIYNYARTPAQVAWEYNRGAPIAHYQFNECTGTTAYNAARTGDNKPVGNNGTITIGGGGTQTSAGTCSSGNSAHAWNNGTSGKYGGSVNFDGVNDFVEVTANSSALLTQSSNFAVSMWVKWAGNNGQDQYFLMNGDRESNGWHFSLQNSDSNQFRLVCENNDTVTTNTGLTSGVWQHVLVQRGSSNWSIYVNGKPISIAGGTTCSPGTSTQHTVIGAIDSSIILNSFNGQIDEVRFYNYPLTTTQIKTEMTGAAVRFE